MSDPRALSRESEPILVPPLGLHGDLAPPAPGFGIVIFAHGSGSSRHSPRNRQVADGLRAAGLGTLLMDLLQPEEAEVRENVFDIDLLARRLLLAATYLDHRPETRGLPIGFFGASTGAGAAIQAAAEMARPVRAIVSRGGRPDLADGALDIVRAPTLLIVGAADHEAVIQVNKDAFARLKGEKRMEMIPGAGHLFEEPGTLEAVTALARDWFAERLRVDAPAGGG